MYAKSVWALSSSPPSAHALMALVYVIVSRSIERASICRKSTSARFHSAALAHAAMAELKEMVRCATLVQRAHV